MSRSLLRWIFVPFALCVVGKASSRTIRAATLTFASRARQGSRTAASSKGAPSSLVTKATATCPRPLATPTTWHPFTPGWPRISASISAGLTRKPPRRGPPNWR